MNKPAVRLAAYVAGVVLVCGSLEAVVRAHDGLFTAASHRALAKAALLDRHGPVELIFFGSSRMNDGVSPTLVAEEFHALRPELPPVSGFNLASAASSLEVLEALSERFAARPGLRLAVIEVSDPQLESAPLQWEPPREPPHDLEGRLSALVDRHVRIVAHRGVLFSDNLPRLPALLLFAPALDGSEIMVSDQFQAWLGHHPPRTSELISGSWKLSGDGLAGVTETASHEIPGDRLGRMVAVARRFRQHGVTVVFVVPPLSQDYHPAPERSAAMKSFLRELHTQTGSEVWDWSGAVLPGELFRGTSHLNPRGRALFSKVLAGHIAGTELLDGRGR